jgi:formylmethanofuran:tetrahydromethanopterin formyltransferase
MALDDLGSPPSEETPTTYEAAAHRFVYTEGDNGEMEEVLVAADVEDAQMARAELRCMVEGMIGEQQPPAEGNTRASPHARTPDGRLVSIQQVVAQCNHLRAGETLSKDRLTRVMQVDATAQRTLAMVSHACRRMHVRACAAACACMYTACTHM